VITGMRGWAEKEEFERQTGEEIEILAIWSSRETRKQRREARSRDEDVKGDGFHERDIREIKNGVGKLMSLSDMLVKNENIGVKELEERVKNTVSK
ncbi:MAG: hypothetical protein ABEJ99_03645, partial [Candidatus Nanohaloarchaea archaeon]